MLIIIILGQGHIICTNIKYKEALTSFGFRAKQWLIQFRVVSSTYLQNLKVWKLTEPALQAIFYDYSKQELTFVKSSFVA